MSNTFGFHTTAAEVSDVFASEIKGKNVLITGTSLEGIGFETARILAKYANLVIITGYNSGRLQLSEDAIKKEIPSSNIRKLTLDLSSLAAVRVAAAEVNAYPEPLHVLINNAAAAVVPFKPDPTKYDTIFPPYYETKSANVLTAIELSRRSHGKINSYSLNPGTVFTNIHRKEESREAFQGLGVLDADGNPDSTVFTWKTIPESAATTVTAAFDPSLSDKPGAYLDDCQVANDKVAPHSSDLANASRLWEVTEKVIGQSFEF
ncbi:hypothetical protein FB451DRAFT_1556231 [Mycena latifolia]|nr:hypothetical protein FB451DRAFT_1556231 [Mycena latifolia]